MRALIIAHGDPPADSLIRDLIADSDLTIATDGAANRLLPSGIRPHIVLGDFDSLDPEIRALHPQIEYVAASSQEASDLDKAIAHSIELGATSIRLAGAGGGRMDHTLANVSLLLKYRGIDISLVDECGRTVAVDAEAEFDGKIGDTLSLIAFEQVVVKWTKGLKWPLENEILTPGTRGVSNLFTESTARIALESGILIACHLRNPDRSDNR